MNLTATQVLEARYVAPVDLKTLLATERVMRDYTNKIVERASRSLTLPIELTASEKYILGVAAENLAVVRHGYRLYCQLTRAAELLNDPTTLKPQISHA